MQAISREALPLPATPKMVTTYGQRNGLLFMLKGPRLTTVSYRTLGLPEYGRPYGQCKQFHARLYLCHQPRKGVTTYGQRNGLLFMLKGPRVKTVYRTLGFPEYGMANASNFTRGFTPASNPQRGNNIILWATKWAFIYVKRAKAKNSVISYLRVPRVRNGQCKQFHARLYPGQQPRKG